MPTKRKAIQSAAEGRTNKRGRVGDEYRPRQTRSRAARPSASPLMMLDDRSRPVEFQELWRTRNPQTAAGAESPVDNNGPQTPSDGIDGIDGTEDSVIVAPGPVRAATRTTQVPQETVLPSTEEPPADLVNGSPSSTDVPARCESLRGQKRRRSTIGDSEGSKLSSPSPSPKRVRRSNSEVPDRREPSGSPSASASSSNRHSEERDAQLDYSILERAVRSNTPSPALGPASVEREVPSQTVIPGLSTIYPSERTESSSESAVKAEDEGGSSLAQSSDTESDSTISQIRPEYGESGPSFETSSSSDSASEPAIKVESEDDDSFSMGPEAQSSSPQPATNALAEDVEDSVMERERLEHEEEELRFHHDNVLPAMEPAERSEDGPEEASEQAAVGQDAQAPEPVIQWMERELGVELNGLREGENKKQ